MGNYQRHINTLQAEEIARAKFRSMLGQVSLRIKNKEAYMAGSEKSSKNSKWEREEEGADLAGLLMRLL